jgi:hypothetical protein
MTQTPETAAVAWANGAPHAGDIPVGVTGIAVMLGVSESAVKKWRKRDRLPNPDSDESERGPGGRIGRGDWWWASTILRWWDDSTVRRPVSR